MKNTHIFKPETALVGPIGIRHFDDICRIQLLEPTYLLSIYPVGDFPSLNSQAPGSVGRQDSVGIRSLR